MKTTAALLLAFVVSSTFAFSPRFIGGVPKATALSAETNPFFDHARKCFVIGLTAITLANGAMLIGPLPAQAADSRVIGEIQGSGLIFKVSIRAFVSCVTHLVS
jgi:hypothetical protein